MHVFTYIQEAKKLGNVYIQKSRHFSKARKFVLRFFYKNPATLPHAIFYEILKLSYIYIAEAWYSTLHNVFIYKNSDTSKKVWQFALHFLIYKKPDTLCYAIFHWIFKKFGGGGILITKYNAIWVKFLYAKNDELSVTLLYTKYLTHFASYVFEKNSALGVRFYI